MDLYGVLGLKKGASAAEIRKAYKTLARKYHPDLNPNDKEAEARFKEISSAYQVLSNADKKKQYDRHGYVGPGGPGAGTGGFENMGMHYDFEGGPMGGFSVEDMLGGLFGHERGERRTRSPRRGRDIHHALRLGFWRALRGTQVRLTLHRQESCGQCSGSGEVASGPARCMSCGGTGVMRHSQGPFHFQNPCPHCRGTGRTDITACSGCSGTGLAGKSEDVSVRIPAGIEQGEVITVQGKGDAGPFGGAPGDLLIHVEVDEHPVFRRVGKNLQLTLPVTWIEASLGARIPVPTPDGPAMVRVPPGSAAGSILRLKGRGPSIGGSSARGDLLVELKITVPPVVDENSKELMHQLEQRLAEAPRAELERQAAAGEEPRT